MRASVRERKTSSRSWSCELDEGRSLWEINCRFWTYKDVSNKLLWFSWQNYIVVEWIKSIYGNSLGFLYGMPIILYHLFMVNCPYHWNIRKFTVKITITVNKRKDMTNHSFCINILFVVVVVVVVVVSE